MFKHKIFWFVLAIALLMLVVGCTEQNNESSQEDVSQDESPTTEQVSDSTIPTPPPIDELDPENPMTEYIQYGQEIFNETNVVIPEYVGAELSCQSCHADGGLGSASTMVGVVADYPQYRPREGVAFTLEDRINGCLMRSMNGEPLPYDSKEMRSLMAYFSHLSTGVAIGEERPWFTPNEMKEIPEPNVVKGEELYVAKNCMTCHGDDGEGIGANTGPALWGDKSFNDGAGLARLSKMAAYVQNNMPPGGEGTLTDQEAADLAAYILMHERPEFKYLDQDFPHGPGPDDFIRRERLEPIQKGEFDWKAEIGRIVDRQE